MKFRITYDDGSEQTVESKAKDYVKFERKYVPMSRLAPGEDRDHNIEWIFALAHLAYVREKTPAHSGGLKAEFDHWLDIVDDVEVIGEDDAPLVPGP